MRIFICTLIAYVLGSLPLSVWLGYLLKRSDIRMFGDGNPGAINAWRVGGWQLGVPALLLDVAKGGIPVALGRFTFGLDEWALVPVALAPIVGHAASPWLKFGGGKAIAVTFGVWSALTFWEVPTVLGSLMGGLMAIQTVSAWTVLVASLLTLVYLLLRKAPVSLLVLLILNIGLLAWTHRRELHAPPRLRYLAQKKEAD
jgi:glycerol-3-phosphate acyltransferase PlsY